MSQMKSVEPSKNKRFELYSPKTTKSPTQFDPPKTQLQINVIVFTKYLDQNVPDLTSARPTHGLITACTKSIWQFVRQIQPHHSTNTTETQDTRYILKSQKPYRVKQHSKFGTHAGQSKLKGTLIV